MSHEGSPVNLTRLPRGRLWCKGCDPPRRFWNEGLLIAHILQVRHQGGEVVTYLKDLCATCGKPISRAAPEFMWKHDDPSSGHLAVPTNREQG